MQTRLSILTLTMVFFLGLMSLAKPNKTLFMEVEKIADFLNQQTDANVKSLFPEKIHGISEERRNKLSNYLKIHGEDRLPYFAAMGNKLVVYPRDKSKAPVEIVITNLKPLSFAMNDEFYSFSSISDLIDWLPRENRKQSRLFSLILEAAHAANESEQESASGDEVAGVVAYYAVTGLPSLADKYSNHPYPKVNVSDISVLPGLLDRLDNKFDSKTCQGDQIDLSKGTDLKVRGFKKGDVRTIQYLSEGQSIELRVLPESKKSRMERQWVHCENVNKEGEKCKTLKDLGSLKENISPRDKAEFDKLAQNEENMRKKKLQDLSKMFKNYDDKIIKLSESHRPLKDMAFDLASGEKYSQAMKWSEAQKKFLADKSNLKAINSTIEDYIKIKNKEVYRHKSVFVYWGDKIAGKNPSGESTISGEQLQEYLNCLPVLNSKPRVECENLSSKKSFKIAQEYFKNRALDFRPLEVSREAANFSYEAILTESDSEKVEKQYGKNIADSRRAYDRINAEFISEYKKINPRFVSDWEEDGYKKTDVRAMDSFKDYARTEMRVLSKTTGKDLALDSLQSQIGMTSMDALEYLKCCSEEECRKVLANDQAMKRGGATRQNIDKQKNSLRGDGRGRR